MQNHRTIRFLTVLALVPVLASCTMSEPTYYNKKKMQVVESRFSRDVPTQAINDALLDDLATEWREHGVDALAVTVTYDPKDRSNGAAQANDRLATFVRALRQRGVQEIKPEILPVHQSESMTQISYSQYQARPPEGCQNLLEMDDLDYGDYKLGCSGDTYLAQQIVRPADLLGTEMKGESDARKQANNIEAHRSAITLQSDIQAQSVTD